GIRALTVDQPINIENVSFFVVDLKWTGRPNLGVMHDHAETRNSNDREDRFSTRTSQRSHNSFKSLRTRRVRGVQLAVTNLAQFSRRVYKSHLDNRSSVPDGLPTLIE